MVVQQIIKYNFILFLLAAVQSLAAQEYTVSGYVEDSLTGERIIGANVVDSISKRGCISNNYGYYSLKVPGSKAAVYCSYVGSKS